MLQIYNRIGGPNLAMVIDSILGISTTLLAQYSSLSYWTVQRFYALKGINWLLVNLLLFKLSIKKVRAIFLQQMKLSKAKQLNKLMVLEDFTRGCPIVNGKTSYTFC